MKKLNSVRILSIISLLFFISSCGYDTGNWPRASLPFEEQQVVEINMIFDMKPSGQNKESRHDVLTIIDKTKISALYETVVNFPYEKKIRKKINEDKYYIKLEILFTYEENSKIFNYKLTCYSYGVANGIFVFDDGEKHFTPGDFVSSFYVNMKGRENLKNESKNLYWIH